MKRRTRLRRQGLPADPRKTPLPAAPVWTAAQRIELFRALLETPLPNRLVDDPDVIRDCRRFGIRETVLSLSTLRALPSAVLARAGKGA